MLLRRPQRPTALGSALARRPRPLLLRHPAQALAASALSSSSTAADDAGRIDVRLWCACRTRPTRASRLARLRPDRPTPAGNPRRTTPLPSVVGASAGSPAPQVPPSGSAAPHQRWTRADSVSGPPRSRPEVQAAGQSRRSGGVPSGSDCGYSCIS